MAEEKEADMFKSKLFEELRCCSTIPEYTPLSDQIHSELAENFGEEIQIESASYGPNIEEHTMLLALFMSSYARDDIVRNVNNGGQLVSDFDRITQEVFRYLRTKLGQPSGNINSSKITSAFHKVYIGEEEL